MNWFDFIDLVDVVGFFKQWGQLIVLSFLAAAVQMYLSGKKFTFFHYFMGVIVAVFSAFLASKFCEWLDFGSNLTTGVIGVCAYTAPHILEGLNKFVQYFFQNPKEFLTFLKAK
ncbi:phage holin family protein [Thalassotalea sp. 1_MG-2023]|uniref:phage holin family protein n=1 Tax=Thalassotalea sp. 1_MG-2023 TaxID=3062680 RepID=UPI0026E16E96|nr:phage holin family protein [Thalassotalea sp. 1_MG-2023]MDO6426225.1 phage holin family protein [Thalassotalea sp. 1_MG-2023]